MYKGPANRLLREGGWQINQLVEELYAIFQTEDVTTDGTVEMNQHDPESPSLIINQPAYSNTPAIVIHRKDPDGTEHSITLGAQTDGSFNVSKDGHPIGVDSTPVPLMLLGRVVGGGPGDSYTVSAWKVDPQISGGVPGVAPSMTVAAKQAQIDPTDTIPPGTWVMLIGYPDPVAVDANGDPVRTWYMVVPVFL